MVKKKFFERFEWTPIEDCTKEFLESFEINKAISSAIFSVDLGENSSEWNFKLYPRVNVEEKGDFISIYLFNNELPDVDYSVTFRFEILSGSPHVRKDFYETTMTTSEFSPGGFGEPELICHEAILEDLDLYVTDGKLTVACELTLCEIEEEEEDQYELNDLDKAFISDYRKMFDDELFTDFELRCSDGEALRCHKLILVTRSPVFHAMLSNDMKESQQGFSEVPDFDSEVMKEVLRFMYCNEIEPLDDETYEVMIYAAEKYQLSKLTDICINYTIGILSVDNVLDIVVTAKHISNGEKLYNECIDFIITKYSSLSRTEKWNQLPKEIWTCIFSELMNRYLKCKTIELKNYSDETGRWTDF